MGIHNGSIEIESEFGALYSPQTSLSLTNAIFILMEKRKYSGFGRKDNNLFEKYRRKKRLGQSGTVVPRTTYSGLLVVQGWFNQ